MRENPPECSYAVVLLIFLFTLGVNYLSFVVFKDPMALVWASVSAFFWVCFIGLIIYEKTETRRINKQRRSEKEEKKEERLRRKALRKVGYRGR